MRQATQLQALIIRSSEVRREARGLSARRGARARPEAAPLGSRMAKHKKKGNPKRGEKARGPGGTLSKKQKMKANKAIVTSWLQQKRAQGADYKKMRAHGQAKN